MSKEFLSVLVKVAFAEYFNTNVPFKAKGVFNKNAIAELMELYQDDIRKFDYIKNGFIHFTGDAKGFIKVYALNFRDMDRVWDFSYTETKGLSITFNARV